PHSLNCLGDSLRLGIKRTKFATFVRPDLKCATRTNLPINHCAEMLTPPSRSDANLYTDLSLSVDVFQERLACSGLF
ncbi:TPA: hypothetical protein ACIRKI_001513, partial [Streptococcus suis]